MRAKAFQGGDLDAFQCRIFPVRSAGVRQPRPVPSCLPCPACLWGQEQEGSACREKGADFCCCKLYSWDFTLPFQPSDDGIIGEEISVLPLRIFRPARVFLFWLALFCSQ